MENNDMQSLFNQVSQILQNGNVPDELKNIVNNMNNSSDSKTNSSTNSNQNSNNFGTKHSNSGSNQNPESTDNSNSNNFNFSDIDINTILKMKQVMDAMNSNKDDPRANLLLSLKPYLKKSRQDKVEQYIKLFGMGKAFEAFNSLGGDVKHELWLFILSAF